MSARTCRKRSGERAQFGVCGRDLPGARGVWLGRGDVDVVGRPQENKVALATRWRKRRSVRDSGRWIDISPVITRRDLGRFIDYAYDRNRRDPHWIPPLRIAERERLSPKRIRSSPTLMSSCSWPSGSTAWSAVRGDRRSPAQPGARRQHRGVRILRGGGRRAAGALLQRVESWARKRGRAHAARAAQPVAQRERRAPHRRLRYRPDADDAPQPAGVRGVSSRRRATAK